MQKIIALISVSIAAMFVFPSAAATDAGETRFEGKPAPAFRLQDQNGEWQSLEKYAGKWVVLYFYPKDDTPGCTTEACNFRDDIYRYRAKGVVVLGVSLDDVESHKEFAEKYELPFPLLADVEHDAARKYGVLATLGPLKFAKRETFLVDPEGRVAKHYEDVDPERHAQDVLADLDALMRKQADSGNQATTERSRRHPPAG